jgi:hypothetical protein
MTSANTGAWKVLAVAVLAAVGGGAGVFALTTARGHGPVATTKSEPRAAQWREHRESRFSLGAPERWRVTADARGRVTVRGESSEQIVIWPFFVAARLDPESARFVARDLAAKTRPDVRWTEAPGPGAGVTRLTGDSGGEKAVAMLVYAGSSVGTAGHLYVTSASSDVFDRSAPTFARILASFEARGAALAQRQAPRFERWTDPAERAFSLEVPSGWSVTGGTSRPSNLLVQGTATATSPDSAITIGMSDAFPVYVEPSDLLAMGGIYEGGTYVDPSGYSSPVRRYAPGARYVTDFLLATQAADARVVRSKDRPDLARRLATYGINTYDAGEVEYRVTRNGVSYTGGALAITERISAGGYVAWHVWRLFLVEARSERYDEGVAALGRLAGSFRIDPGWAARQSELTRRQSGIITQMSSDIGDTLSSGYWNRQAVHDALAERRSRATLEVEDLTDEDGTSYRVESGSSYYWIDPRGTIVGTDTHTLPDVDFRELVGVGA